jgi:hypothetical protein
VPSKNFQQSPADHEPVRVMSEQSFYEREGVAPSFNNLSFDFVGSYRSIRHIKLRRAQAGSDLHGMGVLEEQYQCLIVIISLSGV